MITKTAPTGRLIKGHLLDVDEKKFNEALRAYDPCLYTEWNPKKLHGWGCWEIRRRPEFKTVVETAKFEDATVVRVEYLEHNWLHHVLDAAYLNYDAIRRLKEMDAWENEKHQLYDLDTLEQREEQEQAKIRAKSREEMTYMVKEYRSAFTDYMNLVRKGVNPARVLASTEWVYK